MDLSPKPTFGSYPKGLSYYTLIYLWKKIRGNEGNNRKRKERGRERRRKDEGANNKRYV